MFIAGDVVQDRDGSLRKDIFYQLAEIFFIVAAISADGDHHIFGVDVWQFIFDTVEHFVDRCAAASAGHGLAFDMAHDQFRPGFRIIRRGKISVRFGNGVAIDEERQIGFLGENGDLFDQQFRAAAETKTVVVMLRTDKEGSGDRAFADTAAAVVDGLYLNCVTCHQVTE